MILYYFYSTLLFIKIIGYFLVISLMTQAWPVLLLFSIIIACVIKLLWKYPRSRFRRLSELRAFHAKQIHKYGLHTRRSIFYNNIVLISYVGVFMGLVLYLKLRNMEKTINLWEIFLSLKALLWDNDFMTNIANILLLLNIAILVFTIFNKTGRYFKLHVIKKHLYLLRHEKYSLCLMNMINKLDLKLKISVDFSAKINYLYERFYFNMLAKKKVCVNYDLLCPLEKHSYDYSSPVYPKYFYRKYKLSLIITFIVYRGHYLFVIFFILYEATFCNFLLEKLFFFLPYVFLYDLFIKFITFISQLHLPSDELIHKFLYNDVYLLDNEQALFGETVVEIQRFKTIYNEYIKRGFICDERNLFKIV